MERKAQLERKSKETEITASINIDGRGKSKIKTNIGLLDHMLDLFAFHACFDLELAVKKADLEIDIHHTNEDIGIVLGKLFKKALGEMQGIKRFGSAYAPMESTLGRAVVDISGRGYLTLTIENMDKVNIKNEDGYTMAYLEHFLESFAHNIGATVNVKIEGTSEDLHTNLEAAFKALGLALHEATRINPARPDSVPSTKGIID
ncbi:MAG: imidazoleglycerol-phosphate dehydratase [Candidatus Omnitrophica bacterium]|nr:imidazoleglycerol-phosphate dehydratase [Candidatus Omnitrophota bacterium]